MRSFGPHPTMVSQVGLGCSRLSPFSLGMRFAAADEVIGEALDRGVTVFDTADSYGAGWGERWLGRALGSRRGEVMIITKCGQPSSVAAKAAGRLAPGGGLLSTENRFKAPYIGSALRSSLRRLGTDYADVLMLHNPPTDVLMGGSWAEAMTELREAGLVRYIGLSARTPGDAAAAVRDYDLDCVQLEVNACTMTMAQRAIELSAKSGAAVIARQVFGSGSLVNTVASELAEDGAKPPVEDVAAAFLQSVLEIREVSVVLVGMSSVEHVGSNTSQPDLSSRFISQIWDLAHAAC